MPKYGCGREHYVISYRIHKMASLLNVHYICMTKYGCGGEHYMISYRIHKMASLL